MPHKYISLSFEEEVAVETLIDAFFRHFPRPRYNNVTLCHGDTELNPSEVLPTVDMDLVVVCGSQNETRMDCKVFLESPCSGIVVQEVSFVWSGKCFRVEPRRLVPSNQSLSWVGETFAERSLLEGPRPVWNPAQPTILAICSGSRDRVILYDTNTRKELLSFEIQEGDITCLDWVHNGLYTCHRNGSVFKVDEQPSRLQFSDGDGWFCERLTAHPVQRNLFAGMWRAREARINMREFRICNDQGHKLFSCRLEGMYRDCGCNWSPDQGARIAIYDGRCLKIWTLQTGIVEIVCSLKDVRCFGWRTPNEIIVSSSQKMDFMMDGTCASRLVTYSLTCVHIFDEDNKQLFKTIPPLQAHSMAGVLRVTVSPEGRLAMLCCNGELLIDPDIKQPDQPLQVAIRLFDHCAADVQTVVDNLAQPIEKAEIQFEKGLEAFGSCGKVAFGSYGRRDVAVKCMNVDESINANELRAHASIDRQSNLSEYYGYYMGHGKLYIVSEWMRHGCNLLRFLNSDRGKAATEFHRTFIARSVAMALNWMHARNVLHGDLKLDNIVGDETFWNIKLIDFGTTRQADDCSLHLTEEAIGRHYYSFEEPLTIADDVSVFKRHIMMPLWNTSPYKDGVMKLVMAIENKVSLVLSWLECYKFYLLRHARVRVCMEVLDPADFRLLELPQVSGRFTWDVLRTEFEKAGAKVLTAETYGVWKDKDRSVIGCFDPASGPCIEAMHRRLGIQNEFYGPILVFMDSSDETGQTLIVNETPFAAFITEHPRIPRDQQEWTGEFYPFSPRDDNDLHKDRQLAWCIDIWNGDEKTQSGEVFY